MAAEPELFEVHCDAPPYSVVTGCRLVGFARPEDVRWCRVGSVAPGPVRRLFHLVSGTIDVGSSSSSKKDVLCPCGQPFVCLHKFQFTFNTGQQRCYRLGQCGRCQTIYWDDA
jgi:hypothetical protein